MDQDQMQNAADAALKRRELRRRRILMDPEERMKKIIGYNDNFSEINRGTKGTAGDGQIESTVFTTQEIDSRVSVSVRNSLVEPNDQDDLTTGQPTRMSYTPVSERAHNLAASVDTSQVKMRRPRTAGPDFANNVTEDTLYNNESSHLRPADRASVCRTSSRTHLAGESNDSTISSPPKAESADMLTFMRVRQVLAVILGILIRISFLHKFGEQYVQSIINPFVAFEIAVIGYQRAVNMDLGIGMKGGLWLSALMLSGVKPEIIQTYKNIVGIISAAMDDFTLYFFFFIVIHLIVPL